MAILNKIQNDINKTHTELISLYQTNNIHHWKLLKISLFSGPSLGDFGRSDMTIGIHAKKNHSTLQKVRLSWKLTQYWEWAEYNTLNFAQFFPNDDQFILRRRFYFTSCCCKSPENFYSKVLPD